MKETYEYDVVLSFAGEDRAYVDQVATVLKQQGIKLFYDEFEKVKLWGRDLIEYLDEIYRLRGRYCVMFISQFYARKAWPTQERRSAQARAFRSNEEYILPARFDFTEIPGVRPTVGYIDLNAYAPDQFAALIVAKVKGDEIAKKVPSIAHRTVRLQFIFNSSPNVSATLSEIEDAALQAMFQIITNDYGRKISFPYVLRGGFYERTNNRILYQLDMPTGYSNFSIQDNLSLNCNGELESIQVYRWEQESDNVFDFDKVLRHAIYLFNFVSRWLSGLSTFLAQQWDSTTVTITATMPKNTILLDTYQLVNTDMEVARFNAVDETAGGSVVLGRNIWQAPSEIPKQVGRLLNFVLNNFEYSSFGKKKFSRVTDANILDAYQWLMARVE